MSEYLNIGLDITGLLDNSPTHGKGPALIMCRGIEYMPVRHGHWIEKNTNKDNTHNIYCSRCGGFIKSRGHAHSYYTRDKWAYCPNCGARMDGKDQSDKEYEDSILAAQKSEE